LLISGFLCREREVLQFVVEVVEKNIQLQSQKYSDLYIFFSLP